MEHQSQLQQPQQQPLQSQPNSSHKEENIKSNVNTNSSVNVVSKKELQLELELPSEQTVLVTCVKNLYAGLNKANKNGSFDLQEATQLHSDLSTLSQLVGQINKKAY